MLEKYSLALAIENLLPLALLTFALLMVARMLKRKNEVVGELGTVGCFLIILGNLLNAIGKFLNATSGSESTWLNHSLLFLSAPGFVCLAWALWRGIQPDVTDLTAGKVWLFPLFFDAGLLALTAAVKMVKGGQAWLNLLLTVATIASIAVFLQLANLALRRQNQWTAILFVLSLGMSLALTLRGSDNTAVGEWAKQISNTISYAIFAVAAAKLAGIAANRG
ncbi:MAG: hypothetical protein JST85_10600 [Acidobacteria bacterium]|nr:hypothetical protein [Acidobacteriota bacterium]